MSARRTAWGYLLLGAGLGAAAGAMLGLITQPLHPVVVLALVVGLGGFFIAGFAACMVGYERELRAQRREYQRDYDQWMDSALQDLCERGPDHDRDR